MSMSLRVIQSFESLRTMKGREEQKKGVLAKGQVATAPLIPTVEMLEDLHERLRVLETEHDKKGIEVPDPSKTLLEFVTDNEAIDIGSCGSGVAEIIVKALMGRVMYEVKKLKDEQAGEVRASVSKNDAEWKATATGGHEAMVELEKRLMTLLTGR